MAVGKILYVSELLLQSVDLESRLYGHERTWQQSGLVESRARHRRSSVDADLLTELTLVEATLVQPLTKPAFPEASTLASVPPELVLEPVNSSTASHNAANVSPESCSPSIPLMCQNIFAGVLVIEDSHLKFSKNECFKMGAIFWNFVWAGQILDISARITVMGINNSIKQHPLQTLAPGNNLGLNRLIKVANLELLLGLI
ncbi:hypothetical protein J6590_072421 [Homalodisca vitripennis]|nr:hypothetical protein J6590_072421 [Homalodisca vitripennis]